MSATPSLPDDLPALLRAEVSALAERFNDALEAEDLVLPAWADVLRVFAQSPFVAELAIRRPGEFVAMLRDPTISAAREAAYYLAAAQQALAESTDIGTAKSALRLLRQREMQRIAWRDLHVGADVLVVMHELSSFADAVLRVAVGWLHDHLAPRFGRARAEEKDTVYELVVIAMGKLGGGELNFSSDIDLIFAYGGLGTTVGGRKAISFQDYFDRVGRELIGLLSETTADGYVFRVDMRLRPFGDSGPLSTSLRALEHYYAEHGRDWERYALIKARAVTGDETTVAELAAITRPFVYRRYLDFGALDALREMKQLIDREARSDELLNDVKRGPGGIREIEFTGQLVQLTRGGREPRLRQQSLLAVLRACVDLGFLDREVVATLEQAYRFLRVTEHRLQQVHDWQTHTLPADAINQARLAYAFGHTTWSEFLAELTVHRDATERLFAALLRAPEDGPEHRDTNAWHAIWQAPNNAQAMSKAGAAAGITISDTEFEVLEGLKSERFLRRLSRESRERFERLMPLLLERTRASELSAAGLKRIAALLHSIARRSVYVAFLSDNSEALKRLLELFDASPWIAEQMIAQPLLLDELLDHRTLFAPPAKAHLRESIGAQVRREDGLEQAMESLRAFRNQQVLRVAASDITDNFPVAEVSNQLTYIAEVCIEAALQLAWGELVERFGEPYCSDGDGPRPAGFAVIGYGKLGGWELGYGSDLDLIFLHDSRGTGQRTNGGKVIENDVFFTRLAQRFIHILTTTTATGVAYEIDTRLRPSGNAGMMVCSTAAYIEYLTTQAWVWEHQALVRARGIAGDEPVLQQFREIRAAVLSRPRDEFELKREIATMRSRMATERDRSDDQVFDLKLGAGGITDIEFMVQYAVLAGACAEPSLLVWTDNLRLLETIATLKLLPADACRQLHDAYFAYRAEIHRCTLQQKDSLVDASKLRDHRSHVIEIWKRVFD